MKGLFLINYMRVLRGENVQVTLTHMKSAKVEEFLFDYNSGT